MRGALCGNRESSLAGFPRLTGGEGPGFVFQEIPEFVACVRARGPLMPRESQTKSRGVKAAVGSTLPGRLAAVLVLTCLGTVP
jgi:hypothetical protein